MKLRDVKEYKRAIMIFFSFFIDSPEFLDLCL